MVSRLWIDKAVRIIVIAGAFVAVLIIALIFLFIGKEAAPFAVSPGLPALWNTHWTPVSFVHASYGIIPLITGSLLVTALATLFAVPFGVISAVYISELAGTREREALKPFLELLAAIPSVVLGFFGLVVLVPLVMHVLHLRTGLTAFTGALLLALMALPTITSISEDAIHSVPQSYRDASLALGATHTQTIWHMTVPAALSGIAVAIMLGIGRVIGETMAVLMVTGNAAVVTGWPFDSVRTLTATIAAEMGEVPVGSTHYQALFCIGVVLLATSFLLTMLARLLLLKSRAAER